MIDDKVVRKLAETYLRYCDNLGLGETDCCFIAIDACWLIAIDTVQRDHDHDFTQEQLDALSAVGRFLVRSTLGARFEPLTDRGFTQEKLDALVEVVKEAESAVGRRRQVLT